jgi:NAD/NADP transhydrogenase beta subunit
MCGWFLSLPGLVRLALLLVPLVVLGIRWMRSPDTAVRGNLMGAAAMAGFVALTLAGQGIWRMPGAWGWMSAGAAAGVLLAARARMIRMPELVALFNGIGGAASAVVALLAILHAPDAPSALAVSAVAIGALTFSGSLVAGLKLSRVIGSRPIRMRGHALVSAAMLSVLVLLSGIGGWATGPALSAVAWGSLAAGSAFGLLFMARVGGADMPVSISLLNALSGLAAAVAGYAVGNPVPVAVGAVIGAAGMMLTAIMCRAMNRSLVDVLAGRIATGAPAGESGAGTDNASHPGPDPASAADPVERLAGARQVVIVPGYGMALAQAQQAVRKLFDVLERRGARVCFAIHPVAGRMPGHMHILLAEVDLPYERFHDLDEINPRFGEMDVALIVGANDVVNPAANTAENTPISGMPVLNVGEAAAVIVCNLDRSPGYAGVPNPLYDRPNTVFCPGNAAETVARLADALTERGVEPQSVPAPSETIRR